MTDDYLALVARVFGRQVELIIDNDQAHLAAIDAICDRALSGALIDHSRDGTVDVRGRTLTLTAQGIRDYVEAAIDDTEGTSTDGATFTWALIATALDHVDWRDLADRYQGISTENARYVPPAD